MASPCLRITKGDVLYVVPLEKSVFSIGRRLGADLPLLTREASRHHADIILEAESFVVLNDHRSRFGTFVNDRRVSRHILAHGDRIRFGRIDHDGVVYSTEHDDLGVIPRPPAEPVCVAEVALTTKLRCPACTDPDNFLDMEWIEPPPVLENVRWLWSPPAAWVRRYRCRRCGHVLEQKFPSGAL